MENQEVETKEILEPLTGSSVFVDVPVEKVKEIDRRPSWKDRIGKISKKQKQKLIVTGVAIVVLVGGLFGLSIMSGFFRIEYGETYAKAKELKMAMQEMRSDDSCEKTKEYLNNKYTTMPVYYEYVEQCKKTGNEVEKLVSGVKKTDGMIKNIKLKQSYDEFVNDFEKAMQGKANLNKSLELYVVWHNWIRAEAAGDETGDKYWTDVNLASAVKILLDSGNERLMKYGQVWMEKRREVVAANARYFELAFGTAEDIRALEEDWKKKQADFENWKKENEPEVQDLVSFKAMDKAKLYNKFEEVNNEIRELYQQNYNREIGGCKEIADQVICD